MNLQNIYYKNAPSGLFQLFKVRSWARFMARQMGYELVGEGKNWWNIADYKLFPRKLPDCIHKGANDPYYTPFNVGLAAITSRVGFSYANEGWHPFVQTLKEYAENKALRYEDSTLARLYRQYQPDNLQEVLLDDFPRPLYPLYEWPPNNDLISRVWVLNQHSVRAYLNSLKSKSNSHGWIFFGPHTEEYGQKEFKRLISVYESIKNNGYQSGLTAMDPVNGYFLKKGSHLRFVLMQGNHRVSALKVLGYTSVDALIRQGHPAIVDRAELHRWTEERGGIYSSCLAENLFDSLFEGSGQQKAQRYGLSA